MPTFNLPKILKNRAFKTGEAISNGLSKYDLQQMVHTGQIEKISRGFFLHHQGSEIKEEVIFKTAAIRVGTPSSICLVSALAHYDLTDLIGKKVWIMVPSQTKRSYNDIRLLRVRSPHWKIGIKKESHYWITDIDRTLVDCLVYKKIIGTNIAIQAIRRALEGKKTTLDNIFKMSKKLQVDHRILPYIEAFI
jgi:predicted transcriptional regulator of viral defense system